MALHKHNGKVYCDASDLIMDKGTLRQYLKRARERGTGPFQNIPNPTYDGTNSKRWVLLESVPPELRQQVIKYLKGAAFCNETALSLLEDDHAPAEEIALAATEITHSAIISSQGALHRALQEHIQATYLRYLEHYIQNYSYNTALRCARTCAFVSFVYEQETIICTEVDNKKAQRSYLRSLHVNIIELISAKDLQISVPTSDRRYHPWWRELRASIEGDKEVKEVVVPQGQSNQNARKLHKEAQDYIKYLYTSGSKLPAKQIYKHLLTHAKVQGWWTDMDKGFCPPCYRTVAEYIREKHVELATERGGSSKVQADYIPQQIRTLPKQRNAIWGADGTAHNELVFQKGKTRQSIYVIYVFDYASGKLLACEPYNTALRHQRGERAEFYIEALCRAIRSTGCCPQVLQIDKGPAHNELKKWGEKRGIKVIAPAVGNARAKLAEGLLGRLQNLVTRYRSGWSGQNVTARGPNSQPSPEQLSQHAKQAPTAEEAMAWLRGEQLSTYNDIPFEVRERKPCGKTPNELWAELPSATAELSARLLAMYTGRVHKVKFSSAGATAYHKNVPYTYFPDASSEEARKEAIELLLGQGNEYNLYITDYSKGAHVFDKAWGAQGKYLGYWPLKEAVSMAETMGGKTSPQYKNMRALQKGFKEHLREKGQAAKDWTPLNKEQLQEQEQETKQERVGLSDEEIEAYRKEHYTKRVHPLTGEVHWIPNNKSKNEDT